VTQLEATRILGAAIGMPLEFAHCDLESMVASMKRGSSAVGCRTRAPALVAEQILRTGSGTRVACDSRCSSSSSSS
jgi:hypothetical protein